MDADFGEAFAQIGFEDFEWPALQRQAEAQTREQRPIDTQVWQEALGRARGEGFSVSELKEFTERRGYIRDSERPGEVTLRDVLLRGWEIVQTAKEGVGDY